MTILGYDHKLIFSTCMEHLVKYICCIFLTHLQTSDGAVVANEGVALGAHGLAEDARHPRLHRVGRRVEVLADVGHQA